METGDALTARYRPALVPRCDRRRGQWEFRRLLAAIDGQTLRLMILARLAGGDGRGQSA
jgi:hypothetical protein